jgi:hypothetical protein
MIRDFSLIFCHPGSRGKKTLVPGSATLQFSLVPVTDKEISSFDIFEQNQLEVRMGRGGGRKATPSDPTFP